MLAIVCLPAVWIRFTLSEKTHRTDHFQFSFGNQLIRMCAFRFNNENFSQVIENN